MGFEKSMREVKTIGRKSSAVLNVIGKKAPGVLSTVSKDLLIGAKVGEVAAGIATASGNPEVGAVILAGAETARLGSMAAGGASKSISRANTGDYSGALIAGGTAVVAVQKQNKKNIEKKQKQQKQML